MFRVSYEHAPSLSTDGSLDVYEIFSETPLTGSIYDDTIAIARTAIQFTKDSIPEYDGELRNPLTGIDKRAGSCRARSTLLHALLSAARVQSRLICTETTFKAGDIKTTQGHLLNGFIIPGTPKPGLIENAFINVTTQTGKIKTLGTIDLIPPHIDKFGGYPIINDKKRSMVQTLSNEENGEQKSSWQTIIHDIEDDVTSQLRCLTVTESTALVDAYCRSDDDPVITDLIRPPMELPIL